MVDLFEAFRMERNYKFNISEQIPKHGNSSERTLAKY
jgi:hypothetical protein